LSALKHKKAQINFLKEEVTFQRLQTQLQTLQLQSKIKILEARIQKELCADLPTAFWNHKKHMVRLPYEPDFDEKTIPTKARPIQMNHKLTIHYQKEINDLLDKNIISSSKSSWSCDAFYVNKNSEIERGVPCLVINYKPLNKSLRWIRYPIPNKKDLLQRLHSATIFSKFNLKSRFWQIQIDLKDQYKTTFTVPFCQYEWNVMPFGLKNAPSEFQRIMNDIFNPFAQFILVYIDAVLIFSTSINQHFKHLKTFFNIVKENGLVLSQTKYNLFQINI
jgi:hypothetical protein